MRLFLFVLALVGASGCRCQDRSELPAPTAEVQAPASASASASGSAPPAVSAATPAPATCRKDRELAVDLARWKSRLMAAKEVTKRDALLGELGLDPVVDEAGVSAPATLVALEIDNAALATPAPVDRIVSVRYARDDDNASGGAVRIAVLRALGAGRWCSLDAELEINQNAATSACLGVDVDANPPIAVALVHVTSDQRHTLRITRQSGSCGGCGRGATWTVELHDVRGLALEKLFEHELYSTHYSGCPFPPVSERRGSIELTGPYPRKIVSVTEEICHQPDPDLPDQYKQACTPSATRIEHELRGGKYIAGAQTRLTPPLDELLAIEDSAFTDAKRGAGWGNRCYAHLKKNRLDEASAACRRGLSSSPEPAVKGALHYNLALIAEQRKDIAKACAELAEAKRARPGNTATEDKIRDLGC